MTRETLVSQLASEGSGGVGKEAGAEILSKALEELEERLKKRFLSWVTQEEAVEGSSHQQTGGGE